MDKQEFNPLSLKIEIVEMDDVIQSPDLMKTCRSLTLRPTSGMNRALNSFTTLHKTRSVDALALFANYVGDTVAWLLFGYEDDNNYFHSPHGKAFSHVFVRPDYRRLGIGSRLQRMAAKLAELAEPDTVEVYDDSENNAEFFRQMMQTNNNIKSIFDNQQ
jgi:GNAT superfamily N-acetyltransferase